MQDAHERRDGPGWAAANLSQWFPAFRARQAASMRLICFPYAGAGMPVFRAWPGALPDAIELRVAQLPGRGTRLRERPFEQMPSLVEALHQALRSLSDRPLALFGHSLGAIVAFEVVRRLRFEGIVPAHLFVSGNTAPQLPGPMPPLHQLAEDDFLRELKELNGMPQVLLESKELLEIMLPVVRSDFKLLETYQYKSEHPLDCPITAFGGLRDPRTTKNGLEGWRLQTARSFDLIMVQGDHFFIESAGPLLLDIITGKLLEAIS